MSARFPIGVVLEKGWYYSTSSIGNLAFTSSRFFSNDVNYIMREKVMLDCHLTTWMIIDFQADGDARHEWKCLTEILNLEFPRLGSFFSHIFAMMPSNL